MNRKSTITHIIITAFLALWVFLFWKFSYPYAMAYQEQYQMFLLDWGYLVQRATVPGGLAAYMAEFLTQFYISPTLGSIVIAALYASVQLLMMRLTKGLPYRETLSLLPVLMLWWAMGDESVMPAYVVSLVVNTSQRYAFEAMEAIPNFNKSVRAVRRLAETNLINGEYGVAEKYLTMLSKTVYYRNWAKKRIEMIHNPKLIDSDRVYGYLRRVRLADDFLFSDKELDKICGQLVMHNKDNMVAIQYLLMFPLLNRDLPTFMNYYGYVQSIVKYSPAVCQEAAALAYAQRGQLPPQQAERYRGSATWRYLQGN